MSSLIRIVLPALLMISANNISYSQIRWPNGAKAAICLTYDDGLDCHLDYAIPELDSAGLKGTFFCTGNSTSLYNRMEEWRAIVRNGHEIGNHTLFHPCLKVKADGSTAEWVKPEYDLAHYTFPQFMTELRTANTLLKAVDGKETRTYAYTCGDCEAGGINFTGSLDKLFSAARGDGPVPETMKGYNIYKAPSWGVDSPTAEEMIDYVNKARAKGTIAIFMFHSVGGGYLNVDAREHRKLLEYISANRKDIYCDTFHEVMNYIKNNNPY
jgi:sialate O-acetylesterase